MWKNNVITLKESAKIFSIFIPLSRRDFYVVMLIGIVLIKSSNFQNCGRRHHTFDRFFYFKTFLKTFPMTDTLKDFISGSKTFRGFSFNGCYDMDNKHFLIILEHYIKTGENLLDAYSNVLYLGWGNGNDNTVITQEEYDILSGYINHSIIKKLFSKKYLFIATSNIEAQLSLFLSRQGYDFKRINASIYTSNYSVRRSVFKQHGKTCLRCGTLDNISLDHVIPVVHGGQNSIDNLQPLCKSCNSKKGSKTIDYRKEFVK